MGGLVGLIEDHGVLREVVRLLGIEVLHGVLGKGMVFDREWSVYTLVLGNYVVL